MDSQYIDLQTGASCLLSNYRDGKRIDRIYVPLVNRGKGAGSRMLRAVLRTADIERIRLRLIICTDDPNTGPSNRDLERWYIKNNFVKEDGMHYLRLPQPVAPNREAVIKSVARRVYALSEV